MDIGSARVLVVDDYEYNRDVLARWLKRQGHDVLLAENGAQALAILEHEKIDLMLLDIMMPEMNGYQVLDALNERQILWRLPVIIISAADDIESVVKCIEMGAEDYLSKPFNRVLLRARINASLEKKILREQEEGYVRQIASMRKLADLGTMASGVAHEFNSPLQVITGTSDSLIRRIGEGDIDKEMLCGRLELIRRNAWRCADIANALRTYAQAPVIEFDRQKLDQIVAQSIVSVQPRMDEASNIHIETDLASDMPDIHCDKNHILQAIVHLLHNAMDAMPDGGELAIRSSYLEDEDKFIVSVKDNGIGMGEETRERIFAPFFTTKPLGQGAGLGLSIVSGIIRAHGGSIVVNSAPNEGTEFIITLPKIPKPIDDFSSSVGIGRFDDAEPFQA